MICILPGRTTLCNSRRKIHHHIANMQGFSAEIPPSVGTSHGWIVAKLKISLLYSGLNSVQHPSDWATVCTVC